VSVSLATLPVEVEAAAYSTAVVTGLPVYVQWSGEEWLMTEQAPDVACWVFMPVPQAQAA
jgi:hypothetical protein